MYTPTYQSSVLDVQKGEAYVFIPYLNTNVKYLDMFSTPYISLGAGIVTKNQYKRWEITQQQLNKNGKMVQSEMFMKEGHFNMLSPDGVDSPGTSEGTAAAKRKFGTYDTVGPTLSFDNKKQKIVYHQHVLDEQSEAELKALAERERILLVEGTRVFDDFKTYYNTDKGVTFTVGQGAAEAMLALDKLAKQEEVTASFSSIQGAGDLMIRIDAMVLAFTEKLMALGAELDDEHMKSWAEAINTAYRTGYEKEGEPSEVFIKGQEIIVASVEFKAALVKIIQNGENIELRIPGFDQAKTMADLNNEFNV